MKVLEKNGVEYPRAERCDYCRSLVELDIDDTEITTTDYEDDSPFASGKFRQEYHNWRCPICGEFNRFKGVDYEIH